MRAEIFGVPLDLLTMDQSVARCVEIVESAVPAQHVVINASKVVMMQDVPGLRDTIAACEMVNADGQSIVWAGRILGIPVPERVAGVDLMERLLVEAERRRWPVYFLGARQAVLEAVLSRVAERYPSLRVAGARNGYFDDAAAVANAIRASGARVLFVGISSPKKERFLAENLTCMGPVFAMGVGGSLDVLAGATRRVSSGSTGSSKNLDVCGGGIWSGTADSH
jgi:N-acetylglucosaminyldiphosphoundecaprenol N-acetyl-beta-D-mannosaminyltransferase